MSKAAAIDIAIRTQMAADGKPLRDLHHPLGALPAVGGAAAVPAAYDDSSVDAFLANVAFRLRSDTPAFAFAWTKIRPATRLTAPLWTLEQEIADATTSIVPAAAETAK